jgi:adenosine deaminase
VNENFLAIGEAFDLTHSEICALVRNSFEAAFVSDARRSEMMAELGAAIGVAKVG